MTRYSLLSLLLASLPVAAQAPKEADFYTAEEIPIPEGIVLEASALELMPDGKLAIGTRRGEIYLLENPSAADLGQMKITPYALGMHEILGLAYNKKDGYLYATQRPEITKIKDRDGDGQADAFLTHYDGWAQTSDYHEYNFGSRFDAEGNIWTTLCLTGSFSSGGPWRGWCLRITPEGKALPTCGGIRSPGGIGFYKGDCFYTDNQGPWNGSSSLKHLKPGSFQGHSGGNKWYEQARATMGDGPPPSPASNSRMVAERAKFPQLVPPAVILPHGRLGNSSSGIMEDTTDGKFGPFAGQCFVADQCFSNIARCSMEKVNGIWQGAAILFREGFRCGIIPMLQLADGSVFVGGGDRGWGSRGGRPFALQRVRWTGKTPFEMHTVKARPDGFEITLTQPVDPATISDATKLKCEAWTYIFQEAYGSPEVDKMTPAVKSAELSADGKTLRLKLETMTKGHVHMLNLEAIKNTDGNPLLHGKAYYTLNEIPG